MALDFEQYAAKGNEFLVLLSKELDLPRDQSARILRSVLHAVRNHLSVGESMQVVAQLPMMLKAVYVDGWNPSKKPRRIRHFDDFLNEVRNEDRQLAGPDFGYELETALLVSGVFRALSRYLDAGEFKDLSAAFPDEIKGFILSSVNQHTAL